MEAVFFALQFIGALIFLVLLWLFLGLVLHILNELLPGVAVFAMGLFVGISVGNGLGGLVIIVGIILAIFVHVVWEDSRAKATIDDLLSKLFPE